MDLDAGGSLREIFSDGFRGVHRSGIYEAPGRLSAASRQMGVACVFHRVNSRDLSQGETSSRGRQSLTVDR